MIPEISAYERHLLPLHAAAECAHFDMIPEISISALSRRRMPRQ